MALHWLRSLCGLHAALWDTVALAPALWRAGSAILTPFGSIFLSGSHLNLNKSYFFQIQIASIFSQTMPAIRYIAGAFCKRIYKISEFWSCGWLGQAQNYRECRNRLVALNGNWSVTVTPRRQLALRTCNKQMLYREISQILISISFEVAQHFITHGFRCHSSLPKENPLFEKNSKSAQKHYKCHKGHSGP